MRSFFAFWIGGASSQPYVPPPSGIPIHRIFRIDQPASGSILFRYSGNQVWDEINGNWDDIQANFDEAGRGGVPGTPRIFCGDHQTPRIWDEIPGNIDDISGNWDETGDPQRGIPRMFHREPPPED